MVSFFQGISAGRSASSLATKYAIRNGSNATYAKSKTEAEKLLNQALQETEKYQLDIGLMQINLHWHGHRVSSAAELLDPITNLTVGSSILAEAIKSSPNDLELGIGRYHSWIEFAVCLRSKLGH